VLPSALPCKALEAPTEEGCIFKEARISSLQYLCSLFSDAGIYKEMLAGWSNMTAFKDLQATLRMIPEAQQVNQTKKIDFFLKAAQMENANIFKRWVPFQN
jgi:hypothetical protein